MLRFKMEEWQRAFFLEKGYLVLENVLEDEDLQPVIDGLSSEIENRAGKAVASGELSNSFGEEVFEHKMHESGKPLTNRYGVHWKEMDTDEV